MVNIYSFPLLHYHACCLHFSIHKDGLHAVPLSPNGIQISVLHLTLANRTAMCLISFFKRKNSTSQVLIFLLLLIKFNVITNKLNDPLAGRKINCSSLWLAERQFGIQPLLSVQFMPEVAAVVLVYGRYFYLWVHDQPFHNFYITLSVCTSFSLAYCLLPSLSIHNPLLSLK